MDKGSSNSNKSSIYFKKDPQNFDFFFDETTKEYCCKTCSYKSKYKSATKRHQRKHFNALKNN